MVDLSSKDPSNFRQFILDTPSQFQAGIKLAKGIKLEGDFDSLTVSGMGGSALPVNLLQAYINSSESKPLDIYISRYYSLPPQAKQFNSLNFISSYSGTTEEVISSLEEVHNLGLPFVGFSSGGKVEELCKEYGAPHVKLPVPYPNYQPRMGTGYFFGAMFQVLINQGLIKDKSGALIEKAKKFSDLMTPYEGKGKELAKKLKGKTPVIYASSNFASTAMVWKIKINENAKTPAFWNYFPELNHNEMVGFTTPQAKFFIVMLRDREDHPRNLKRYETTAQLLSNQRIESEIIDMDGDDVFSKMFLSISLADWTSYYLALEYGQDPTPVEMVEKLKKILAS
ncbi:MAG: Mannose-6-phosphate isomerase / glucose-6-phosphate isomerase [Microgenomates group bacterium GW2011_GWA2_37_6]|nr:MAG: Mannose-6-phosphate isomerase / glucose-6-phosphate isomerase [Microgenomates group bacterium GW2011_GWA2_37_6]